MSQSQLPNKQHGRRSAARSRPGPASQRASRAQQCPWAAVADDGCPWLRAGSRPSKRVCGKCRGRDCVQLPGQPWQAQDAGVTVSVSSRAAAGLGWAGVGCRVDPRVHVHPGSSHPPSRASRERRLPSRVSLGCPTSLSAGLGTPAAPTARDLVSADCIGSTPGA